MSDLIERLDEWERELEGTPRPVYTAPPAPQSSVGDMELSVGARPLDEITAELDATEEEWSRLGALHGPFGKWDNLRKARLAIIAMKLREQTPPAGAAKWTDDLLDKAAHAHADYVELVDTATIEHARYLELDAKRDALMMAYNRGQGMIRLASRLAA